MAAVRRGQVSHLGELCREPDTPRLCQSMTLVEMQRVDALERYLGGKINRRQ